MRSGGAGFLLQRVARGVAARDVRGISVRLIFHCFVHGNCKISNDEPFQRKRTDRSEAEFSSPPGLDGADTLLSPAPGGRTTRVIASRHATAATRVVRIRRFRVLVVVKFRSSNKMRFVRSLGRAIYPLLILAGLPC